MSVIINVFLSLPLWLRVVVSFAVWILVLWKFLGRYIQYMLSIIPFLLKQLFRMIYLVVEFPVAALHERMGMIVLGKMENKMSRVGECIDSFMSDWYKSWHIQRKIALKKCLIAYVVCVVLVLLPSWINVDNNIFKIGQTLYIRSEIVCVSWLEKHGWYNPKIRKVTYEEKHIENEIDQREAMETILVVSGVNSSLLVRDVPATENCTILDRLKNDDTVIWRGEMVFSVAENDHIEPWVKVVTKDNVEGWSRLYYLHPEQYADMEFYVTK